MVYQTGSPLLVINNQRIVFSSQNVVDSTLKSQVNCSNSHVRPETLDLYRSTKMCSLINDWTHFKSTWLTMVMMFTQTVASHPAWEDYKQEKLLFAFKIQIEIEKIIIIDRTKSVLIVSMQLLNINFHISLCQPHG